MTLLFRYPALGMQYAPSTPTSSVDCTATAGGVLGDADSRGAWVYNHSQVRAATDEPVPSPSSPGLNWNQIDSALFRLSRGRINLDVHPTGSLFSAIPPAARAGRVVGLAIQRSVLVNNGLGFGHAFTGGHAITVLVDQRTHEVRVNDPLVDHWFSTTWPVLQKACEAFMYAVGLGTEAAGSAYYAVTRDVFDVPASLLKYSAMFSPGRIFIYQLADGVITSRHYDVGFSHDTSAPCSAPAEFAWPAAHTRRKLVQVSRGRLQGKWIEPGTSHVRLRITKI